MTIRGSVRDWGLGIRDRWRWKGHLLTAEHRALVNRITHLECANANSQDGRRIEDLECSRVLASDALRELERHVGIIHERQKTCEHRVYTIGAHDTATDLSVGALQHEMRGFLGRLNNLEDDVQRYQDGE